MLRREMLDTMQCAHGVNCDCGILFMRSKCHDSGAMEVSYDKEDGCLHINCNSCKKPVAVVKVAR